MKTLGVTGGIGSGKTYFCRLLENRGIPVFYSDIEAKRVMVNDSEVVKKIIALLGEDAYANDGGNVTLDKAYVAKMIFSDKALRDEINCIVHPAVIRAFERWKSCQNAELVAFESAIIFECNMQNNFDKVVLVIADEATRVRRVMKRDNSDEIAVRDRMKAQMSDFDKMKLADYCIDSGDGIDIETQIDGLLDHMN